MSRVLSNADLHLRADDASEGPYDLSVTPKTAGWEYSSLFVLSLAAGQRHEFATGPDEMVVLPLEGSCVVEADGHHYELVGRTGVFDAVTDLVYLPRTCDVMITSERGGRFALPAARCERRLEVKYRAAVDVPVEIRGAGSCSRQVNNLCAADWSGADRLIAVEVLTPAGNWSSYPPHKHDEDLAGEESALEEVYYFEVAPGPDGAGVGYQRVYATGDRPVDVTAEVRSGDTVLVPHGWHGPSMAAPGYDLYYLNVMAGPSEERAWLISDDPTHAWVRDTWAEQDIDPRLPLTRATSDLGGSD